MDNTHIQALKIAQLLPTRALCFTPILHSLFHSIPPTILPGKHYWPHDTDEDIESWGGSQDIKIGKNQPEI